MKTFFTLCLWSTLIVASCAFKDSQVNNVSRPESADAQNNTKISLQIPPGRFKRDSVSEIEELIRKHLYTNEDGPGYDWQSPTDYPESVAVSLKLDCKTICDIQKKGTECKALCDIQKYSRNTGFAIGFIVGGPIGCIIGGAIGHVIGGIVGGLFGKYSQPRPDDTPPRVACPGPIPPYYAGRGKLTANFPINFVTSATDETDGDVVSSVQLGIVMSPEVYMEKNNKGIVYVYEAPEGFYFYRYYANDKSGNIGFCDFTIEVAIHRCPAVKGTVKNGFCFASRLSFGRIYGGMRICVCQPGHNIDGNYGIWHADSKCEWNNETKIAYWDDDYPQCTAVTCPMPMAPENGTINCELQDDEAPCDGSSCKWNTRCQFSCKEGYRFEGRAKSYLVCGTKDWEENWDYPPICKDITAPELVTCPDDIIVTSPPGTTRVTVSWEEPQFVDNSGEAPTIEQMRVNGDIMISGSEFTEGTHSIQYKATDEDGNSNTECGFKIVNRVQRCLPLAVTSYMANPECDPHDSTILGTECKFSCKIGTTIHGSDTAVCGLDSQNRPKWIFENDERPVCEVIPCVSLSNPTNGRMLCEQWMYGDMCQPVCRPDYDLPTEGVPLMYHCGIQEERWYFYDSDEPGEDKLVPYVPPPACLAATEPTGFSSVFKIPHNETYDSDAQDVVHQLCTSPCKYRIQAREDHLEIKVTVDTDDKTVAESIFRDIIEALQYEDRRKRSTSERVRRSSDGIVVGTVKPACPFGQVPSRYKAKCVDCAVGTFYNEDLEECIECPIGTYQPQTGSLSCLQCPPNTSTAETGAASDVECIDMCTPGSFSPNGVIPCMPCPRGTYQHQWNRRDCSSCPSGTTTLDDGHADSLQCESYDLIMSNSTESVCVGVNGNFTSAFWFKLISTEVSCNLIEMFDNSIIVNKSFVSVQSNNISSLKDGWNQMKIMMNYNNLTLWLNGDHIYSEILGETNKSTLCIGNCQGKYQNLNVWQEVTEIEEYNHTCNSYERDGDILSWTSLLQNFNGILATSVCDDHDDCLSNPCLHGKCTDELGGYSCTCFDGYNGTICDVEIDECEFHECRNGATCVDSIAGYTCDCPPKLTGKLCDLEIVDGGYTEYSGWEPCSVSCGGGTQTQTRACTNPPPANGGKACEGPSSMTRDCNKHSCPACIQIRPPTGGDINCTKINDDFQCIPYCFYGGEFAKTIPSSYNCGPSTNFMWTNQVNREQEVMTIPACTYKVIPEKVTAKVSLSYPKENCTAVYENGIKNLNAIACAQNGNCSTNISREACGKSREKRESSYTVVLTVTMIVESPPPIVNLTEDNPEANVTLQAIQDFGTELGSIYKTVVETLESAAKEIDQQIANGDYDVIVNGEVVEPSEASITSQLACPAGYERKDLLCIACPPGTYSSGGFCVACPIGTYQAFEAQSTCNSCPDGLSTAITGTEYKSDCKEICKAGSYKINGRCELCPSGFYQPFPSLEWCFQCPHGQTSQKGSTDLQDCHKITEQVPPPYKESNKNNEYTNTNKNNYNQTPKRIQSSTSDQRKASEHGHLLTSGCFLGHYLLNGECIACPPGTFQPLLNQDHCIACPDGYTSVNGSFALQNCTDLNYSIVNVTIPIATSTIVVAAIALVIIIIICKLYCKKKSNALNEEKHSRPISASSLKRKNLIFPENDTLNSKVISIENYNENTANFAPQSGAPVSNYDDIMKKYGCQDSTKDVRKDNYEEIMMKYGHQEYVQCEENTDLYEVKDNMPPIC